MHGVLWRKTHGQRDAEATPMGPLAVLVVEAADEGGPYEARCLPSGIGTE